MQFLPILSILLLGVTLQDLVAQQAGILPVLDRKIDYASDVAPIFEKHCVDCHGVDVQESNLRVDVKASLLRGGDLGEPAILKGKGADSFLIQVVAGTHKDLKMPPEGKGLSDTEVSILRTWIDQGVNGPDRQIQAS